MSFLTMTSELTGVVPKVPNDYAKTLVNRAWRDVRRQSLWSFLLFEANWTTPKLISGGTVSTTQGSNIVTFDGTAITAINAIASGGNVPSPVTARQFRIGVGTIYNIWANDGAGHLTLDRAYQEPTLSGQAYQILQCYYAAPMKDFWQWLSVRDMVNWNDLITTKQRTYIDGRDPQRTIYLIPSHVVPYQMDLNPASPTFNYPLFELWGVPTYVLTYQLYGLRKGQELVLPTDTLPPQIGEDCVMELAKMRAYEWAEANKQDERSVGSDYRFLMGEAKAEYKRLYAEYRRQDRALIDNFATRLRRNWMWPSLDGWYQSISGYASPGAPW
jgi:hypothetical protein